MNDREFKGDLYYLDPRGESWKITQRPGENNPNQRYWHADKLYGDKAHRVSASAYKLLTGIDSYVTGESGHDGATSQDSNDSDDTDPENSRYGIGQIVSEAWIENRRQAYLG